MLNLQGIALLDDEIQPNSWLNGVEGPRVMVANNGNISFDDLNRKGRPKLKKARITNPCKLGS